MKIGINAQRKYKSFKNRVLINFRTKEKNDEKIIQNFFIVQKTGRIIGILIKNEIKKLKKD